MAKYMSGKKLSQYPKAFANIIDKNEITVIIEQSKYDGKNIIENKKDWKILKFDMILPFQLKKKIQQELRGNLETLDALLKRNNTWVKGGVSVKI